MNACRHDLDAVVFVFFLWWLRRSLAARRNRNTSILPVSFFCQPTSLIFRRQSSGQTDGILIARPRLHSMQRGKNAPGTGTHMITANIDSKILPIPPLIFTTSVKKCQMWPLRSLWFRNGYEKQTLGVVRPPHLVSVHLTPLKEFLSVGSTVYNTLAARVKSDWRRQRTRKRLLSRFRVYIFGRQKLVGRAKTAAYLVLIIRPHMGPPVLF